MTENTTSAHSMQTLPTEIFINILSHLSGADFMKCRQVCTSWRLLIDELACRDLYWYNMCKKDFGQCYLIAKQKASSDLDWYFLYRTMYMWPRIASARKEDDEFASASHGSDEVRSIEILPNGIIAVHNKSAIKFYDLYTCKLTKRSPIYGTYARYTENRYITVLQNYHLHLFLMTRIENDYRITTIDDVKMFFLKDQDLYYVKLNDEIHVCDVHNYPYTFRFIKRASKLDGVMSLGYKDDCLNILTYQRNIYTIINKSDMVYRQSLTSEPNLLNILHRYNFLEQLDWRVYFQWMFVLRHTMPEGSMRDTICIRPYGDVFIVGSNFGVLCIYHKPFTNGELDLFKSDPIFTQSFMERSDIPVLASCPILQIDLVEIENGHIVFVAMPKKVAMLKFTHDFMHRVTWSVKPRDDIEMDMLEDILDTTSDP